jgi:hypothetical protein
VPRDPAAIKTPDELVDVLRDAKIRQVAAVRPVSGPVYLVLEIETFVGEQFRLTVRPTVDISVGIEGGARAIVAPTPGFSFRLEATPAPTDLLE